jgi:nitroreductase
MEDAMDTLEAIYSRRSVRKFESRAVPEELIEKLLKAAMNAPTARNAQAWHFIVIDDRAKLAEYAAANPNAAMAKDAPLGILVCGDLQLEKSPGYWVVDCSAAVENMLLAAHAMGLGAVWTGVYPREERMDFLHKQFGLPDEVKAHSLVVVGYPAEHPAPQSHFRPDRVRKNHW